MKKLPRPLPGVSPKTIFLECVESFRDSKLKVSLMGCASEVKNNSDEFEAAAVNQFKGFQPHIPIAATSEQLEKVYTQKFVPKSSPGRKYYDGIMALPQNGICPMCGVRPAGNLDHYFPKSRYPLLVVTPLNLIPVCRDCNYEKRDFMPAEEEELTFNPYFDEVDGQRWLTVRLGANMSVEYYVKPPDVWDKVMTARAKRHIVFFKLQPLYGIHAAQEINDCAALWKDLYEKGGPEQLRRHIEDMKDSIERNELNSWRAALYRGLVDQFTVLEGWLKRNK